MLIGVKQRIVKIIVKQQDSFFSAKKSWLDSHDTGFANLEFSWVLCQASCVIYPLSSETHAHIRGGMVSGGLVYIYLGMSLGLHPRDIPQGE